MTSLRSAEPRAASTRRVARRRTWLDGELERLARERPSFARRLAAVTGRPEAVLVPVAAVVSGALGAVIPGGDAGWFRSAGAGMLGSHFFDVFSSSGLQIGPLYLLVLGVASKTFGILGSPALTRVALAGLQGAALVWLAMWTVRRAARSTGHQALVGRWAVGAVLTLGGFVAEGVANGHPEEILLGLLLANAALSASTRSRGAGLLLGVAIAVKQWAVVGGGLLLLARRRSATARAVLVVAAVVVVAYGPFFLLGDVRTFDFAWGIPASSLLGQLGHPWHATDWQLRVVQGAIAGCAGAAAAWARPRTPLFAPVCAIAVRLLLDPLRLSYYSGPLVVLIGVWLWSMPSEHAPRYRTAVTALSPLVVLSPYLLPTRLTWYLGSAVLIGVVVVGAFAGRRTTASPAPTTATQP